MAVMDYRTQDGLADYGFSIEFQPDVGWRVYIIFQSFYQYHDDSPQLPYQSIDCNGRRYVDWSAKLNILGDARTVAALWPELIQRNQLAQEPRRSNNEPAKGPRRLERLKAEPIFEPAILDGVAAVGQIGGAAGQQSSRHIAARTVSANGTTNFS